MGNFNGRVAVVTGASRGIGRAIAARLHRDGAQVVGTGTSMTSAPTFEQELPGARFVAADVTDADAMKELFRSVAKEFGSVDHVVCNAGITLDRIFLRMGPDDWSRVIETNLTGTYNTIRGALRYLMKSDVSSVVALSSIVRSTGNISQANYAASKAGIEALCRSVAKEMGRRNVRINAIAPGFIETDMTSAEQLGDEVRAAYLASIPMGRAGTTDEIAGVACFLLSSEASYITGQVIGVNGGMFP